MQKKVIAAVLAVMTAVSIMFCGCGIHIKQSGNNNKIVQKSEPAARVFVTSDKKYSLTATSEWKDVLSKYKKDNKDMSLMIRDKMIYAGIITKPVSDYRGLVKIQNVKDYGDAVITGMEESSKNFESSELMTADIGKYSGYYADARIDQKEIQLGYRMYFLKAGGDYVEIIFWTDKSVFEDKTATIEKIANTFR